MSQLAKVTNIYYIVKSGDTLNKIAIKFSTDLQTLLKWNPRITDPNLIYPNQEIKIGEKNIIPIVPENTKKEILPSENEKIVNEKIEVNKESNLNTLFIIGIAGIALYFLNKD